MMRNLTGEQWTADFGLGYLPMLMPPVQFSICLTFAAAALHIATLGCTFSRDASIVVRRECSVKPTLS